MRLAKATYGQLEILSFLCKRGHGCQGVPAMCEQLGLTYPLGLKLVHRLVHADLLVTKRGPHGGIMLSRPASSIRLGDTIRRLEAANTVDASDAVEAHRSSQFVDDAFHCFLEILDTFTLEDLANGRTRLEVASSKSLKIVGRRSRSSQATA
jgi:Rrf2 family transcriptional regulator, nitric oxide-sensitive transcriptional repressor